MANDSFGAAPTDLNKFGAEVNSLSEEFTNEINTVYSTLDTLVTSEYVSPEARAIKKEIDFYHSDLDAMAAVIKEYGDYFIESGNTVVNNQEDITGAVQGTGSRAA